MDDLKRKIVASQLDSTRQGWGYQARNWAEWTDRLQFWVLQEIYGG